MADRIVIVAAVEPSVASEPVVQTAANMSRMMPGPELHFIHVIDVGPEHNTSLPMTELVAQAKKFLDETIVRASKTSAAPMSAHVGIGAPAKRILQITADLSADLLIVGSHERHGLARLLGSVARRAFVGAPCPVLVARPKRVEDADVPAIEPPCPDCLATQQRTHGSTLWCELHARRHAHGHLHYTDVKSFGDGSMLIRPET